MVSFVSYIWIGNHASIESSCIHCLTNSSSVIQVDILFTTFASSHYRLHLSHYCRSLAIGTFVCLLKVWYMEGYSLYTLSLSLSLFSFLGYVEVLSTVAVSWFSFLILLKKFELFLVDLLPRWLMVVVLVGQSEWPLKESSDGFIDFDTVVSGEYFFNLSFIILSWIITRRRWTGFYDFKI